MYHATRGSFKRIALCPALLGALLIAGGLSQSAGAQGLAVSNGPTKQLAGLSAGEQMVISKQEGVIDFAGKRVTFDNFSGVIGYASDVAYIAVIDGHAQIGDQRAGRGRVMMMPPFGGKISVERFEAARLRDAWNTDLQAGEPILYASLDALARQQQRSIFLGRLGRTNFNVAASGLASDELAKRTIVGGLAVQDIRFGADQDIDSVERRIVTEFARALVAGDAQTVAQFLDPLPYGNSDLRGEATQARVLIAEGLIAEHDWAAILGSGAPERLDANFWSFSSGAVRTTITLRPTPDFAFVKTVSVGS